VEQLHPAFVKLLLHIQRGSYAQNKEYATKYKPLTDETMALLGICVSSESLHALFDAHCTLYTLKVRYVMARLAREGQLVKEQRANRFVADNYVGPFIDMLVNEIQKNKHIWGTK